MRFDIEVKSSGPGPKGTHQFTYPHGHPPFRSGRVLTYWTRVVGKNWPWDGVVVIIRRANA